MIIGTVKEIKNNEFRVGLTPSSVSEYVRAGHQVLVENNAGVGSGFSDQMYIDHGAKVLDCKSVWEKAEMIVKVKEPLEVEFKYLREGLILYTYLHLAVNEALTHALIKSKTTGVAYETIMLDDYTLPCLKPMSEVAGRLSAIEGAKHLEKHEGGLGILISGVPGTQRAQVLIIGAGVVGVNALKLLVGLEAKVTILDVNLKKLTELDQLYGNKIETLYSSTENIKKCLPDADLVISSVLIPGEKAPKLIKRSYYPLMKKNAVIIDVAIDQGGTTEVSIPTTHENPTFLVDNILHYCVANMPGAVPKTSSEALNNATIKYGLKIANQGLSDAIIQDRALRKGINIIDGKCVYEGVCKAFELPFELI